MALHRLRIGQRLTLAFCLVLSILIVMAGMAAWQMGRLAANTDYYAVNLVPSYEVLHAVGTDVAQMRRAELGHALATEAPDQAGSADLFAKALANAQADVRRYEKELVSDAADRRAMEAVMVALQAYREAAQAAMQRSQHDGESRQRFEVLQAKLDAWWDHNVQLAGEQTKASTETYRAARIFTAVLSAAALLIGVAAAVVIRRSILGPLGDAVRLAHRVAEGDLTGRLTAQGRDEVAELLRALQKMNDGLAEVVQRVRQSSDSIATGSTQIATGNADLSQRTEEQASNLQQTTASMMQMNSAVQKSSDTAREATTLAGNASDAAQQGGAAVGRVVETMAHIAASSKKIADIIGVIDGIAFQTNLLALNAAVEAARAGEQGRGFAIVAGEVRVLAQRSADAAKEIKSLIHASVEDVDAGIRLVADAGASMDAIVEQVRKVGDLIAEMDSTASEQAAGIGQVNDAMTQLDQVTQQNAALVEQSAAAAESLKQQAAQLEATVSVFRVA